MWLCCAAVNVLFISPNFPPQFWNFCVALRNEGANVLALGDVPWNQLCPELQRSLKEYVQLPDLSDYEAVHRTVAALIARHGRISRLDSNNEHWLPLEARLREDFNVRGLKQAELHRLQHKSSMADVYRAHGIPAPALLKCSEPLAVRAFVHKHGLPVVFKPDHGVGGVGAFKVKTQEELEAALTRPLEGLVLQPFVPGRICTWDGLVDAEGTILFSTSFIYSTGIMEVVQGGLDVFYYTQRDIPPALDAVGRQTVKAFGLKERFFHCEFFEMPDGSYQGLEINVRCPGGFSTDLQNWSCDIDQYALWAKVITGQRIAPVEQHRGYYCAHVARRREKAYRLSHEELVAWLGPALLEFRELYPPVSVAMGELVYLVRFPEKADFDEAVRRIGELA